MDWHYVRNDERCGPSSALEIRRRLASGELSVDTLVWRSGLAGWVPASQVPELTGQSLPANSETDDHDPSPASSASSRERPWPMSLLAVVWAVSGSTKLLLGAAMGASVGAAMANSDPAADSGLNAAFALLFLGTGALQVATATALWRLRPWGRIVAIAGACVGLLFVPIGTVVNGVVIAYLTSEAVGLLFSSRRLDDMAPAERFLLRDLHRSGLGVAAGILLAFVLVAYCLFAFFVASTGGAMLADALGRG